MALTRIPEYMLQCNFTGVADGQVGGAMTDNLAALKDMDNLAIAEEAAGRGRLRVVINPGHYHLSVPFHMTSNAVIDGHGAIFDNSWIIGGTGLNFFGSISGVEIKGSPWHGWIFHRLQEIVATNLKARNCQGFGFLFGGGFRSQIARGVIDQLISIGNVGGIDIQTADGGIVQYDADGEGTHSPGGIEDGDEGTGYTDGHYRLPFTGGTGTDAWGIFTVSGGEVMDVKMLRSGKDYTAGDELSAAIPGGSGFTFTVQDITGNNKSWFNAVKLPHLQVREAMLFGFEGLGTMNYDEFEGIQVEGNRTLARPAINLETASLNMQGHVAGVNIWDFDTTLSVETATLANPTSIKSTAHGLTNVDTLKPIFFFGSGWSDLNGEVLTVTVTDVDNFTLNGVDATKFAGLVAGGELGIMPAPKDVDGITNTDPAVVNIDGHGYSNNDFVVLSNLVGGTWNTIEGNIYQIAAVSADHFQLVGLDSSGLGSFTSGMDGCIKLVPDTNYDTRIIDLGSTLTEQRNRISGNRVGHQFFTNYADAANKSFTDIIRIGGDPNSGELSAEVFGMNFVYEKTRINALDAGDTVITGEARINGFLRLPTGGELTISGGAITATQSYHTVDTEADASTDDLDTINGGDLGSILILRPANSSRTVVVKDGIGNIRLAGDFSLTHQQDTLTLFYATSGAGWQEISRSSND